MSTPGWFLIRTIGVLVLMLPIVGCSGDASTNNTSPSNDDIAAFIEANPEFAESPDLAPEETSGTADSIDETSEQEALTLGD
ncbi:MAG: hypothetical protein HKN47_11675 [Pirellulaceae bacterium]|nr:hypothetical protein [Pirellulaceae bacterium]